MSQLVKELSSKTVKEVPGIVSKYASENLTQAKVQSRFMNWMERYRKEQIEKGTLKPFTDFVVGTFIFSYVISWPREYAHYRHEQEAKLKGAAAH
ncbi:hypothetical protein H632_c1065p1 [Helicosporidium sp. ATCC 50920]|nr:hypothetical protein H632_c1065p1 [Helicosporidium sp. ATCC 50920]|eukprot:KDD74801.1 hypothetical protein H632_c1065p1 [Helicosporidium sp. ATCC 50920]